MIKNLLLVVTLVITLAACNKDLGPEYSTSPVFGEMNYTPILVTPESPVSVSAVITSEYGLQSAWIVYYLNEDEMEIKTTAPYYYTEANTSVIFKGSIPKQKAGTKVTFQVRAITPYNVLGGGEVSTYTVVEAPEEKPEEN